ncbi:MAG: gamma-glutamyl-gamma-aminobutyrate hydrolase family protein [Fluviicola sp.]|nr:gamma-glutamyl-gamma-aminobutyrate hydrolase family protein [Fluviicola sp.]
MKQILVIDSGSNKTKYIESIVDEFIDVKSAKLMDFKESDLENVCGVIISGAPLLVTEVDPSPYISKLDWIKMTELPVLGICFGHQIIGLLHGAFASRMKEDRDWQTIEAYEDCPLFDRLPNAIEMMEDHCETISIPAGFELVASSDACVNEVMQHKEKTIFGVQFHPEVSGNHGRILIENFIKLSQ